MEKRARFGVVGGTGTVGREVLAALWDADVLSEDITLWGSERSVGDEVEYGDDTLEVEETSPEAFRGHAAVILAVPEEVAKALAPAAQAAGAWVVDVSAAHRLNPDVPLVVPAVNPQVLERPFKGRLVATPGPIAAALATVLEPLRTGFGARRAFVTALLGASSHGRRGIAELEKQTAGLLSGREEAPEVFPHRLGFNLIPQVGEGDADGDTAEERAWRLETARLWAPVQDAPAISGTAVQVPTFYGHAFTLTVELNRDAALDEVRDALRRAPGLKVLDATAERVYPMPMLVTADPTVHVGRLRQVAGAPRFVELFAAVDNAGRGSAQNAVEAARALLRRA
jgi:aspartate-semialdehyde dehydrogenase